MKKKTNPKCENCGRPLKPKWDKVAKKMTGYLWSCKCSPRLVICIG